MPMRPSAVLACGLAAVLSSLLAPTSAGAEQTSFFSPPPATQASSITVGPDGNVWFSDYASSGYEGKAAIGRIAPGGLVSEFPLPPQRSAGQIVAGPDGNLWFTETLFNEAGFLIAKVGRISPAGEFVDYRLDNAVGSTNSIAVGPDGNLWFTERFWRSGRPHSEIGRIGTTGKITRFLLPPQNVPRGIVAGPDGNLWFTERTLPRRRPGWRRVRRDASRIGRITPTGRITHFPLPDKSRVPVLIAVGPDGNLWFTEGPPPYPQRGRRNKIGRITTRGSIAEFPVPGIGGTGAITAGPAGRIWFTTGLDEGSRVAIDSITPAGKVAEPICLDDDCELIPKSLTEGPEGDLWFSAGRRPIGIKGPLILEAGFVGKLSQ